MNYNEQEIMVMSVFSQNFMLK